MQFTLTPRQLSQLTAQAQRVEVPGQVQVFVGGGQPLTAKVAAGRVLRTDLTLTSTPVSLD
ncbi:MAG: hypothetical protein ACRYFZ_05515 [Janthinobacterium lividum]